MIRGNDHRPNEALHRALTEALGARPPEYVHFGLILGAGRQEALEARGRRVGRVAARGRASRPRPCARYLEELGLPRHDVHLDLERIRSLAVDVLAALSGRRARRARSASRSRSCPRCAARTT